MSTWSHFIFETYCGFSWMHPLTRKTTKYLFPGDPGYGKRRKWDVSKNPHYKKENKAFCASPGRMRAAKQFQCFNFKTKRICPFFLCTDAEKRDRQVILRTLRRQKKGSAK
jgi:hypothetical protein